MVDQKILNSVNDELREKIIKCFSMTLFVGAGVSVGSGIPTFRGKGIGKFFQEQNPIYLLSTQGFLMFPKLAWQYSCYIYNLVKDATPNLAHKALVAWQNQATKRRVVKVNMLTTNYDGLIQKAGGEVEELHGNINNTICPNCRNKKLMSEINQENLPPQCESCNSILLPDIVLLDSFIKQSSYDISSQVARGCSIYIAIGTSGVNSHSFGLMKTVNLRPNTTLIEINPRPSHLTKDMDYVIRGNAEDILPQFGYGNIN
ncbi:MAG: Sir2 family NAD-dependent protein deacetylase [Blastocatellia bacterium]